MAIGAHAEHHDVEGLFAEYCGISVRLGLRTPLPSDAVHMLGGNWHVRQQCGLRHCVVARGVIPRDASLVRPEQVYAGPIDVPERWAREFLVDR